MKEAARRNRGKRRQVYVLAIVGVLLVSVAAGVASTLLYVKPSGPQPSASIVMRIYPHLTVKEGGRNVVVPAGIGVNPDLWKDHSLDAYGPTNPPMAPLHTNAADGTIYVESTVARDYTLGQFLDIWGFDTAGKTVKMVADGQPVDDYRNHVLRDGEEIDLDISP